MLQSESADNNPYRYLAERSSVFLDFERTTPSRPRAVKGRGIANQELCLKAMGIREEVVLPELLYLFRYATFHVVM
jgi:hypothetical protein